MKREFDEAKKFMRFVIPGLVCLLEIGIALGINYRHVVPKIDLSVSQGLAVIIAIFLTSGALGYIFIHIYFAFTFHINYKPVLRIFQRSHKMMILKQCGTMYSLKELSNPKRRDALIVANISWMFWAGCNLGFSEVEKYAARNADILHGNGATLVGTISGIFLWIGLYYAKEISSVTLFGWILTGWIVLFLILFYQYWRFRRLVTKYSQSALLSGMSSLPRAALLNKIYMIK